MSKIAYEQKRFTDDGLAVIGQVARLGAAYAAQGLTMSLRQLYYRLIAADLFPESRRHTGLGTKNTLQNYKWLIKLVTDARIGGLVDWDYIADRTRTLDQRDQGWDDANDILDGVASQYRERRWDGQPEYIEVWVEKEAQSEVIGQPCDRLDVSSFACKGYGSVSSLREAALRFRGQAGKGRKCTLIYLGDHDPSGMDMPENIRNKMVLFGAPVTVDRIALNADQITDDLPPSPAKVTDSRYQRYADEHGDDTWELDAMEPAALDALIESAIREHLDEGLRDTVLAHEAAERATLAALAANWPYTVDCLRDAGLYTDSEDEQD